MTTAAAAAVGAGALDSAAGDLEQLLRASGGAASSRCPTEAETQLIGPAAVASSSSRIRSMHCFAPDESVSVMRRTNSSPWERATKSLARVSSVMTRAGGAQDRVADGEAVRDVELRGSRRGRARRPRADGRAGGSDRPRRRGADGSGEGRGARSGRRGSSACRARARARPRRRCASLSCCSSSRLCCWSPLPNTPVSIGKTALFLHFQRLRWTWTPFSAPSPPTIRAASRRPPAGRPPWERRRR